MNSRLRGLLLMGALLIVLPGCGGADAATSSSTADAAKAASAGRIQGIVSFSPRNRQHSVSGGTVQIHRRGSGETIFHTKAAIGEDGQYTTEQVDPTLEYVIPLLTWDDPNVDRFPCANQGLGELVGPWIMGFADKTPPSAARPIVLAGLKLDMSEVAAEASRAAEMNRSKIWMAISMSLKPVSVSSTETSHQDLEIEVQCRQ